MENTISKRGKIRLFSYTFTLILVLTVGFIANRIGYKKLTRVVNASGQRSLSELDSYISSINTDLTKGLYINTPTMLQSMATELTRDAAGAKSALSALPVSDIQLDNTYKFLSQVGSFVYSLEKKLDAGEKITDEEREQIKKLIAVSQSLSDSISAIIESVEAGNMSLYASGAGIQRSDAQAMGLASSLSNAEQTITDYPTLIYDGPFSDNTLDRESVLLKQSPQISSEQALEAAAAFFGLDKNRLKASGEMQGSIPSYIFTDDGLTVAVSKQGGYAVYLLSSANAGEAKLSEKEAVEAAGKFLEDNGYLYMEESYYSVNDGICTVNFAMTQYGITCYPDLIKVSISLSDGKVVSYDASSFIMNHVSREYAEPVLSVSQAQQNVSPLLEVMSAKRAIIPTDFATEQDVYEFHCKNSSGQEFLVYIDTQTGQEDNILILLYADNGILTK